MKWISAYSRGVSDICVMQVKTRKQERTTNRNKNGENNNNSSNKRTRILIIIVTITRESSRIIVDKSKKMDDITFTASFSKICHKDYLEFSSYT